MTVIGYAPGAYDLFHVGHLNILKRARAYCDHLIAGVVTDDVVAVAKNQPPLVPFPQRLEIVRSVRYVDDAVADAHIDKFESWRQFRFDVLFKGDDWCGTERGIRLERLLGDVGARVVYFPYTRHTSSTALRSMLSAATPRTVGS